MSGDSEFVKQICIACAKLYDVCLREECEKHQWMEYCKLCAQAYKKYAEECRNMTR
jgi:hypothetical protein